MEAAVLIRIVTAHGLVLDVIEKLRSTDNDIKITDVHELGLECVTFYEPDT